MKLTVSGRQLKITQAIEDHLQQKLNKVLRNIDDSADVHVALAVEKHRHFAEITLKEKGITAHSEAETDDLYQAMDQAIEKIEKQVSKHWEKIKSKKLKKSQEEKDKQLE
ncbi:ribosome hibernation-promoting factor, HPF/YfiA family [Nitrospina gracilis]|uniref:ribosome hibernation-promoting factor, HPF/YfiA family n=1 Tax=Nitrospina gracilis TaxID=35801 RepID=UPI001F008AA5|nr:ribosome-associated translation inhibitor RaiA [Nitrospina gracilis]MCF8720776.1 putative sigma-54 modulation protein [Nitrospina gracilis Nb-211]